MKRTANIHYWVSILPGISIGCIKCGILAFLWWKPGMTQPGSPGTVGCAYDDSVLKMRLREEEWTSM